MTLGWSNSGPFTLMSGEALAADRLVKLSGTTAVYADSGDEPIGITTQAVAIATAVACHCMNGNVRKLTASGVIAAGAAIYADTDGKISASAVGKQLGIALLASTADGGKIPCIVWGPRGGNDFQSGHYSVFEYFDDFIQFDNTATVGRWVVAEDAGGTQALIDAAGGILQIVSDGDDNDATTVASVPECFLFDTDRNLFFEIRLKLTEANDDDAGIWVGLTDLVTVDMLQDADAGPAASYDGAGFFKVDGGTVWQFEASNAAVQSTNTDVGDFTDGEWTRLAFLYDYNDGVTANVTPYVNGVADTAVTLTIAGLAEMHVAMSVKAGDANAETLLVDYVHAVCPRDV